MGVMKEMFTEIIEDVVDILGVNYENFIKLYDNKCITIDAPMEFDNADDYKEQGICSMLDSALHLYSNVKFVDWHEKDEHIKEKDVLYAMLITLLRNIVLDEEVMSINWSDVYEYLAYEKGFDI